MRLRMAPGMLQPYGYCGPPVYYAVLLPFADLRWALDIGHWDLSILIGTIRGSAEGIALLDYYLVLGLWIFSLACRLVRRSLHYVGRRVTCVGGELEFPQGEATQAGTPPRNLVMILGRGCTGSVPVLLGLIFRVRPGMAVRLVCRVVTTLATVGTLLPDTPYARYPAITMSYDYGYGGLGHHMCSRIIMASYGTYLDVCTYRRALDRRRAIGPLYPCYDGGSITMATMSVAAL